MTPLRQRMLEDMQLRRFSARTQEAYVHAVRQLAGHFHRPPDRLTEDDLRQYFLCTSSTSSTSPGPVSPSRCAAIKFFYERTLGHEWKLLGLVRPAREKELPVVAAQYHAKDHVPVLEAFEAAVDEGDAEDVERAR